MALTAMFLFPVIWEMSTTFTMRLLAIAACIGLIGVGLAPDFKDTWINRIHCGSAALTLLSSQLWVGCTSFLVGSYSGVAGFYRLHGNRHE
ncbi:hypothetical protein NXW71_03585 [Parabacteroides merdae]|nr:hypothetical protein [Parabacteroides merdae]